MRTYRRLQRRRTWATHFTQFTNIHSSKCFLPRLVLDNLCAYVCSAVFGLLQCCRLQALQNELKAKKWLQSLAVFWGLISVHFCSSCLEKVINLTREALDNTAWPCCSCPVTIRGKMWLRSPHISWVCCICRFPPFFRSLASPSALYGSPGMNASRFQLHCDFIYISA